MNLWALLVALFDKIGVQGKYHYPSSS